MNKKTLMRMECWQCMGFFTLEQAREQNLHFASGRGGSWDEGVVCELFWLVDPADGIVVEARWQLFGPPLLFAAADVLCELCIGKTYEQARRLTVELIDRHLKEEEPVLLEGMIDPLFEALRFCVAACQEIVLPSAYVNPIPHETQEGSAYPHWKELQKEEKLAAIEAVLDQEIRPYIALDEGGIEVLELTEKEELKIAYKGSCTSCVSSVGTTLSAIQQMLQARIHPEIRVVPDLENLQFP